MTTGKFIFILLGAWLAGAYPAAAKVAVTSIFASNMVLQRGQPVPVRGTADAGEAVTVSFGGQDKRAVADADGRWTITLDPLDASREPRVMTITGSANRLELKNILVGEVWLCVGQSNVAFKLGKARDAAAVIAAADRPLLRTFGIHFKSSETPVETISGGWVQITPQNAATQSAVAYFFGSELQSLVDVPVGVIAVALSGSYAEVWFSREAQASNPATRDYLAAWDWLTDNVKVKQPAQPGGSKAVYADNSGNEIDVAAYRERFKTWKAARALALKNQQTPPDDFPAAFEPLGVAPVPDNTVIRPVGGFNGSISPLLPCALKGVVWYQGESHFAAERYGEVLSGLITDWRRRFESGSLPFLVVGLPNWGKAPAAVPVESREKARWPWVREQQFRVAETLPDVFVTVNTDTAVFDKGDLHPTNKHPVGHRLALLAAERVYGLAVQGSAPVFNGMEIKGGEARLVFAQGGGGLVAQPGEITDLPADLPASPLLGFAVAGEDRQWEWAQARIEGDAVVVSAPGVGKPVAVRYNWANYPVGNLFGKNGLPAASFRTDTWFE